MEVGLIIAASAGSVLALIGLLIFLAQKYEKARSETMRAISNELGLQFYPEGDSAVVDAIGHLRLFNQGHGRRFRNMMFGRTNDVETAIFEYQFVTGGGKNQQTHLQTVISFRSPHLALPVFELRPEHLFHRIGQAFGYGDIDFDDYPEFSRRYQLRGPDEAAVREFFVPGILAFFETNLKLSVEASGDRLIVYRARRRVKPEDVRSFMEDGFRVYSLLRTAE